MNTNLQVSPLDWQHHLTHCPSHFTVGCTHIHKQPLFLLHQIHHITICSGEWVAPATSDVITPLSYQLSLCLSYTLHQSVRVCYSVFMFNLSSCLKWKIIQCHISRQHSDTFWLHFLKAACKLVARHINTRQVKEWQNRICRFTETFCSAAQTGMWLLYGWIGLRHRQSRELSFHSV